MGIMNINNDNKKYCSTCKEYKNFNEFSKSKKEKYGLSCKCKKCYKQQYLENKENVLKNNKNYYYSNKEKIQLKQKEYRKNNIKAILVRNKARKLKIKVKISQKEINALIKVYNNKCCYCSIDLNKSNIHLDHYIPLARGGEHNINNLVPSCNKCNLSKGSKLLEEWKNNDNKNW